MVPRAVPQRTKPPTPGVESPESRPIFLVPGAGRGDLTRISTIEPLRGSNWYGYGSIPINTIFNGMNIHLPAILRFWHTAISSMTSENHSAMNVIPAIRMIFAYVFYMFHMSERCYQYFYPVFTLVRKRTCVQSCSIHIFSRSWPSCQTMLSTNVCFFMFCPSFSWRKLSWCPPSLAQGMQAGSFRSLAQRLALPSYGLSWPRGLPRSQWPSSLKARQGEWKLEKREDLTH